MLLLASANLELQIDSMAHVWCASLENELMRWIILQLHLYSLSNPVGGSVPLSLDQISDSTGMAPAEIWARTSNSESLDCSQCYLEERESSPMDSSALHGRTSPGEEPPYPQCPEVKADQPTEGQANTRSSSPTESHPISQSSSQGNPRHRGTLSVALGVWVGIREQKQSLDGCIWPTFEVYYTMASTAH